MFLAFHDWRYINTFKTSHFANFEQFKINSNFSYFEQVKIDPITVTEFGEDLTLRRIIQTLFI